MSGHTLAIVPSNALEFTRRIDLPAVIVWDAIVDPDLVEGWLAAPVIEAREGGRYDLAWQTGGEFPPAAGVISVFEPPAHLVIETDTSGTIEFALVGVPGGSRGEATDLSVRLAVQTDRRMLASTIAHWRNNLDQLEDLLRGHPVDWDTWTAVRGPVWEGYLRSAQMRD